MARKPCCAKEGLNRGAWTAKEDQALTDYIRANGEGQWRNLPQRAGLSRCGKSCRLRWLNYLKPGIKRGNITHEEDDLIIRLHKLLGNRWSLIAGRLPGRTDNEIKNHWNTAISKKLVPSSASHSKKKSNPSKEKSRATLIQRPSIDHPISPRIGGSCVIRTKASRCTKVFIRPEPQNSDQQLLVNSEPPVIGSSAIRGYGYGGSSSGLDPLGDVSPFVTTQDDPSDFNMDFEMDDKVLSDFLNHDFPTLCDGGADHDMSSSIPNPTQNNNSDCTNLSAISFWDGMLNDIDLRSMAPLLYE